MKLKLTLSVSPGTKEKLEEQAENLNYASISAYIDAIANQETSAIKAIASIKQIIDSL